MRFATVISLFALTGCATGVFYYQDGSLRDDLIKTEAACIADAAKRAPVDTIYIRDPGQWKTRQVCSGPSCQTESYYVPGLLRTADANAGLRSRLERACMAAQGYERLEFERCEEEFLGDARAQTRLPASANVACFAKDPQGRIIFLEEE